MNSFRNGSNDNLFDADYIALLAIASVILEIYSLDQSEKSKKDSMYISKSVDRLDEKIEKLYGKMNRIEHMMERSVYYDR